MVPIATADSGRRGGRVRQGQPPGAANYAIHATKPQDVTAGRRLKAQGASWYRVAAHHLLTLKLIKQSGG